MAPSFHIHKNHNYFACPLQSLRGLTHDGYQPNHKIIGLEGANVTIIPTSANLGDPYKYKFGGKEYQEEFDVNVYDFGARNYDPALGRRRTEFIEVWMNVDPITHHSQSPYTAFDNNPVYFTDPEGKSSQPPTKNIKVTIITSVVDKNNNTTITQTTYDNTYTKNSDGSMSVTSSKSEISNIVSGDGQITNGNSVNTTTESYTIGTDGQKSDPVSSSDSKNISSSDTHSAFGEWTEFVSDYNKSHNEVYNKDMINKGSDMTTTAANIGTSVIGGGLRKYLARLFPPISMPGASEVSGDFLSRYIGKNNQYLIIFGVQEIYNGTLIKPMKSPSNRSLGERDNGPKGGYGELFKGLFDLFNK